MPQKDQSSNAGFRRARQRASRACEVCHARKVRCDVTIHQPCTNCVAFGCECKIPESKNRRKQRSLSDDEDEPVGPTLDEETAWVKPKMKPPPREGTIFMGSASYVPLFANGEESTEPSYSKLFLFDKPLHISREDITVLKIKGAFHLPPKEVCDDLVEAYFEKIHPMLPCINKNQFMKKYKNPNDQPSLLLMQCIFCCAAHLCKNPALLDQEGTTRHATELFNKRAKALFETNYEPDRNVSMVSALLLSTALDSPDRLNNNIFYWCRVAVTLAQSIGLHRWLPHSKLDIKQKRMARRIWWCLFVRDRSTATAYGRPIMINLEDSDVPMVEEQDFLEEDDDGPPEYPTPREHILYFLNVVKLHEIMGLVLRQQYSMGAERLRLQNQLPDVSQCDIALATWINNLPEELRYSIRNVENHTFLTALIYLQYYTVLCLAHRPQVVHFSQAKDNPYPSWGIAFQAAHMIVRIFENLRHYKQTVELPAFCVYTAFSALIMLVYQMESPHKDVLAVTEKAFKALLVDIKTLGKVYDTAQEIGQVADRLSEGKRRSLRLIKRRAPQDVRSDARSEANIEHTKKLKLGQEETDARYEASRGRPGNISDPPANATAGTAGTTGTAAAPAKWNISAIEANNQPENGPSASASPQTQNQNLYMVTQAQDEIETFEPQLLFPEVKNEEPETQNSFLAPLYKADQDLHLVEETTPTGNMSSGDEYGQGAPPNLTMVDWYDFLMTNQEFESHT